MRSSQAREITKFVIWRAWLAVALYSIARRHSERAALGFVTTRVIEAAVIFVGVLAIMASYTLRNDVAGATLCRAGVARFV